MDAALAPIVVASAVDLEFLPLIEVVATSIARSATGDRPVDYHVFYAGPDNATARRLASWRRGSVGIVLHRIGNPWQHFSLSNGLPPSALMRLSLPLWLADISRVLYLDADLVVETDLAPLFDMPLDGRLAGATIDLPLHDDLLRHPEPDRYHRRYMMNVLGFDESACRDYRQSGVMLLDLDGLRRIGFTSVALSILELKVRDILMADQCVINIALRGRMARLEQRWNTTSYALEHHCPGSTEPGILHFAGRKPWLALNVAGGGRWWAMAWRSGRAVTFALRLIGSWLRPSH